MKYGLKEAAVLCILRAGEEMLLLRRTKKLHYGQYVPVGGHIDPFENARDAVKREVYEEAGITLDDVSFCGVLQDTAPIDYNWISYVYQAEVERFDPPFCREGSLEWVPISSLDQIATPPTDQVIYQLVAQGQTFILDARYNADLELEQLYDEISGEVYYPQPTQGQQPQIAQIPRQAKAIGPSRGEWAEESKNVTTISIHGTEFWLDGEPTYKGRVYQGQKIQGMLFNVRAVQATFDDANAETRKLWAYPDTGQWDPDRNTAELCAMLPQWKAKGVLGLTVNLQGGGPMYVPEIYHAYDNNGFTAEGALKPAFAGRLARVLDAADQQSMVVMVGLFYWMQMLKMKGEWALWRAADEALTFLESTGHGNILIELANEVDVVVKNTPYDIFGWDKVGGMLTRLRDAHPSLLYSTSGGGMNVKTGGSMPSEAFVEVCDYVLVHGNGTRPNGLAAALDAILDMDAYKANPKPIVINEDSPAVPNMEVCWPRGVSWGYYDQGFEGQADDPYVWYGDKPRYVGDTPLADLNGYQTPPVNWGINTPFKRLFFDRVAEITGAEE